MSQVTGINANDLQSQYLTLLTTQLRNQDPLAPTDSNSFITQLSQLSTVQGIQTLNASFNQVLKLQQLTQGSDLIGKTVQYNGQDGVTNGKVTGLTVDQGNILLQMANESIKLEQIQTIS
jgi:flagellar basal-body rod modification protein FlgD